MKSGTFAVKTWGRAVRISEAAESKAVISRAAHLLADSLLKETAKLARSKKYVLVPSTLEWALKRPAPTAVADPYDNQTILAAKVKGVKFDKLHKFKRDHGWILKDPAPECPF